VALCSWVLGGCLAVCSSLAKNNAIDDDDTAPIVKAIQQTIATELGETGPTTSPEHRENAQVYQKLVTSANVLTSEATMKSADFLETLKELNWLDRLDFYKRTGKIPVNLNAKGRLGQFSLQPGQIYSKYFYIDVSLVRAVALAGSRGSCKLSVCRSLDRLI
jgi:hypothetical protein